MELAGGSIQLVSRGSFRKYANWQVVSGQNFVRRRFIVGDRSG
uniref:Uncharacterized protein n=1 Tax=Rhizophora mucronata TaxID=61149 RepID=A0A2P2P184_RHIMU